MKIYKQNLAIIKHRENLKKYIYKRKKRILVSSRNTSSSIPSVPIIRVSKGEKAQKSCIKKQLKAFQI